MCWEYQDKEQVQESNTQSVSERTVPAEAKTVRGKVKAVEADEKEPVHSH